MAAESPQTPGFRVTAVEPDKDQRMLFTKPWYLFFQTLASILTGSTVVEDDSSQQGPPNLDGASLEIMFRTFIQGIDQRPQADVYSGLSSVDDLSPAITSLREEVAELRKQVDALQQGNIVL